MTNIILNGSVWFEAARTMWSYNYSEIRKVCLQPVSCSRVKNEDIAARVKVISLLCHLDPRDTTHCYLATDIMRRCGRMYLEVGTGAVNKFANSLIHRRRHRLIQTMLLLQAFTTQVTKPCRLTCKFKN